MPPAGPAAAPAPAASGALDADKCGGRSPCTLQAWMTASFGPPLDVHDFRVLVPALAALASIAPPGYPNWASIARDGAGAAAIEDDGAVKAACRGCHAQYLDRYKKEMRDKKI